jgi:hypothetical protein
LPPELLKEEKLEFDKNVDVWSIGVIAHILIIG